MAVSSALLDKYHSLMDWDMHWGELHIVVEDGNLYDCHIQSCVSEKLSSEERNVVDFLMSLDYGTRRLLWELSDWRKYK